MCAAVLVLMPGVSQALSVAPAIIELSGSRGEVIETSITLINTSTAEQIYYLGTLKFIPREESGAPQFIPKEIDHSGLPEWIAPFSDAVRVPARSKADVPITIAIPSDVNSGGHYAAVTVSEAPSQIVATNGARIQATTAVLLLLTVEGEATQKAALLDFTSPMAGVVSDTTYASFEYRLQNQGNVHISPVGNVTLSGLFGQTISMANANSEDGRILPGATRTYKGEVGEEAEGFMQKATTQLSQLAIGPVTATLDVEYGESGETVQSQFRFWVFPWQLLVSLTVLVIALVLIIRGLTAGKR